MDDDPLRAARSIITWTLFSVVVWTIVLVLVLTIGPLA